MNASENSKEVLALVKRLKGDYAQALIQIAAADSAGAEDPAAAHSGAPASPCEIEPTEPLLCEFVRSFMIWEATTAKADAVLKRLHEAVVDFNELRICLPDEMIRVMGERYPRVEERALRLRAALAEIYHRQHAVTLEPLAAMSKREAKDYLDSLEGVPRFVSNRVMLKRLGAHAAPVDGRINKRLIESGIADVGATPDSAAATLERIVKAGDLLEVYALLQAWADDAPLNFSDTPVELPKRSTRGAAHANNHHEPVRKRPGKPAPTKKKPTT